MGFKTMCIKPSKRFLLAFSLVEVLIASALFGIAGLTLGSVYLFSTRTFAAMANYGELDQHNRDAMDTLTREIRECQRIVSVTTNNSGTYIAINLINNTGASVSYGFDSVAHTLTRISNQDPGPEVLVPHCTVLSFDIGQRTPDGTNFDVYPPLNPNDTIQVINMTWKAWQNIPGSAVGTSEEIQTAHVVIRSQYQNNNIVTQY